MENIVLKKAALHILDVNHDAPILSDGELDIDNDSYDFLEKHITRVLKDGDLKKATFVLGENPVYALMCKLGDRQASGFSETAEEGRDKGGNAAEDEGSFLEVSRQFAEGLFSIMKQNPDIPSGDLVICLFEGEGSNHLALLKMNYRSSFIHYVSTTDAGVINELVKQKTTLPGEAQKVDECVFVNLDSMELQLIEKKYEICAVREFYLSKHFLKCETELSSKQKMKILDKTVSKLSKKHFDEDFEMVTQMRSCLAESVEQTGQIEVGTVAEKVFGRFSGVKDEYIEAVKKAGVVEETVVIPENVNTAKKFSTHKLKTDSGIEINFPSQLYNDKDVIEFINNPDGTISILIKNVGKVVNK